MDNPEWHDVLLSRQQITGCYGGIETNDQLPRSSLYDLFNGCHDRLTASAWVCHLIFIRYYLTVNKHHCDHDGKVPIVEEGCEHDGLGTGYGILGKAHRNENRDKLPKYPDIIDTDRINYGLGRDNDRDHNLKDINRGANYRDNSQGRDGPNRDRFYPYGH